MHIAVSSSEWRWNYDMKMENRFFENVAQFIHLGMT
jgi:hypothetical protein